MAVVTVEAMVGTVVDTAAEDGAPGRVAAPPSRAVLTAVLRHLRHRRIRRHREAGVTTDNPSERRFRERV
jgi:hypothetical protein